TSGRGAHANAPFDAVLGGALRVDHRDEAVVVEGANLFVQNGAGATSSANGLGNLIVGYDEDTTGLADRTGSHNLVVGPDHNYPSYSGFVSGYGNTVSGPYAAVVGGIYNEAQ